MMVTEVKTSIALLFDSARMASSFCSIVRSWKSWVGTVRTRTWLLGLGVIPHSMSFSDHEVDGEGFHCHS